MTAQPRTYTFSFGTITLPEGWPEITPDKMLLIEITWKERGAKMLESVVVEVMGHQPAPRYSNIRELTAEDLQRSLDPEYGANLARMAGH